MAPPLEYKGLIIEFSSPKVELIIQNDITNSLKSIIGKDHKIKVIKERNVEIARINEETLMHGVDVLKSVVSKEISKYCDALNTEGFINISIKHESCYSREELADISNSIEGFNLLYSIDALIERVHFKMGKKYKLRFAILAGYDKTMNYVEGIRVYDVIDYTAMLIPSYVPELNSPILFIDKSDKFCTEFDMSRCLLLKFKFNDIQNKQEEIINLIQKVFTIIFNEIAGNK